MQQPQQQQQSTVPVLSSEPPPTPAPTPAPPKELHGVAKLAIEGLPPLDLLYDFNILADTEELTGVNMLTAIGHLDGNMGAKELRALLYGLTRMDHPNVTLSQLGKYLRQDTFVSVFDACWEACVRGSGDAHARKNLELLQQIQEANAKKVEVANRAVAAVLESTADGLKVLEEPPGHAPTLEPDLLP